MVGFLSLAACGAGTDVASHSDDRSPDGLESPSGAEGGEADRSEQEPPPILPDVAPRWLAVSRAAQHLSVVRFDDPERPEIFTLAEGEGVVVSPDWVHWSPLGTNVAFLTCDADTLVPSLFIASAGDDFRPRAIGTPFQIEPSSELGCRDVTRTNAISWMGPDTVFAAVASEDFVLHYRIPVASLEPELLAESDTKPLHATSPHGALYVAGRSPGPWDLWFAGEADPPQRMSATPANPLNAEGGPLTWAPDGQRATWWTHYTASTPSAAGVGESLPPELEVVPGRVPEIGRVHVPTGLVVDEHPHGNLYGSNEFAGRELAPKGPALAYAIYRTNVASFDAHREIMLSKGDDFVSLRGGLGGSSIRPAMGFLDGDVFFFSRWLDTPEGDDITIELVLREAGEDRRITVGRYAAQHFDAFRDTGRLFFVRSEVDRSTLLWTFDTGEPNATAEQVAIEGSVVVDSVLKQGQVQPLYYNRPADAEAGEALLLAASDDTECRFLERDCQTQRWVVDFAGGQRLIRLNDKWLQATVSWVPDGSGLVAATAEAVSYIPGPAYRGSIRIHPATGTLIIPTAWPEDSP